MAGIIQNPESYNKVVAALKRGEFDDRPDVKRRLAAEANQFGGQMTEQRLQEFSQRIDTQPGGEMPETVGGRGNSFLPGGVRPGSKDAPSLPMLFNQASRAGVDVETGAPPGLRARADLLSLSPDAAYKATEYLIAKELEEAGVELPEGVPAIFKEENTGRLAYFRPQEDGSLKPTLINPAGIDRGDFMTALDDAAQIAVEVPAAIGGALGGAAMTGGSPVGAALGGATAVGAVVKGAHKFRRELALQMGIPEDIVDQVSTDDEWADVFLAAGFELAGPIAMGAVRAIRNSGRPLSDPQAIAAAREEFNRIREASNAIEQSTGVRITPTAGAASGSPELLVIEANVHRDMTNKKGFGVRTEAITNRLNIGKAVKRIINNEVEELPPHVVERTTQRVQGNVTQTRDAVQNQLAAKQRGLDEVVDSQTSVWQAEPYVKLQREADGVLNTIRNREDGAWTAFRESTGFDGKTTDIRLYNGGDSPIVKAVVDLNEGAKRALSENIAESKSRMARSLGYNVDDEGALGFDRLLGRTLDMEELHRLSSTLKNEKRKIIAGKSQLDWQAGDIDGVIQAIEQQLQSGQFRNRSGQVVGGERAELIRASLATARKATVDKVNAENRQVIHELLLTDGKEWVKQPDAVRGLIFRPRDSSPLAEAMRHVEHNPQIRGMMARELDNLYRERVFRDGEWKKTAHDAFISDYKGHMDLILGKEGSDMIRNARDMGMRVEALTKRAARTEEALRRAYGRNITSQDVAYGNIAADIIEGRLSNDQSARLMRRLNNTEPELVQAIRQQGGDWMKGKLMAKGDNTAGAQAITNLVRDHGGRLETVYGKQFVNNLGHAATVMSAMERTNMSQASKIMANTPMMQAFRSIFGPLSPIQRRLTAAQRLRQGWRNAVAYDLVTDPSRLDTFIKLSRTRPNTIAAVQGFTALGVPLSDMPEETQEMARRHEAAMENSPRSINQARLQELMERREKAGETL